VGAALLEAVMRRASQLNLRALWVNKHRANDQARAFYAALGFEELDILRLKLR
jgi:GNAT superfamily N-acetyltransferase